MQNLMLILISLFSVSGLEVDKQFNKVERYDEVDVLHKGDSTGIFMEGLVFRKSDSSLFSFSEVQGKVFLLDFWATWCGPCIKQHPYIEELYQKIDHLNFEIISVSVDRNFNDWQHFFDKNDWKGINIYVGWDSENPLFKMVLDSVKLKNGKSLSKVSVPQYYLLDKSLQITKVEDIADTKLIAKIREMIVE